MDEKKKMGLLVILVLLGLGGAVLFVNVFLFDDKKDEASSGIQEDGYIMLDEEVAETKKEAYDDAIMEEYGDKDKVSSIDIGGLFDDFEQEEKEPEIIQEEVIPEEKPEPEAEEKPKVITKTVYVTKASKPAAKPKKEPEPKRKRRKRRSNRDGFYGYKEVKGDRMDKSSFQASSNVRVVCKIFNDQEVIDGGRVTFRCLDKFAFQGNQFPRNTLLYGNAEFKSTRVVVNITQASVGNKVTPIQMEIYDQDGGLGVYSPQLKDLEEEVDGKVRSNAGTIVDGIARTATGGLLTGAGSLIKSGKNKRSKAVNVYDGYTVYAVYSSN
ncbi:conjugative transposon protein TraM [Xanthovirga aplysinae]|uniref:conjugative transposon protein TraM n=1 Tax=Xanthovirga aplysinae TaxID=2529853 RepID=UPI0012BCA533|nr:conjugative transposon protein TraM [Xanthovirga aplysinae]MTI33296.1 conjugative transposon protein TraM [Xanthovirga aplysinae]